MLRLFSYCHDRLMLRLQWINAYTVVAMDTTERIHLLSVKTDSEIEVSSIYEHMACNHMYLYLNY